MAQDEIVVAKLSEVSDYRACQEVQRQAWGLREDGYLVPVATLSAVNKYGGLVLGARRAEKLVGFSFAFLGKLHGELVLYSQLTATLPEEQGGGVGFALKTAQRTWAREQELAKIVWAFDPLQPGNANFNLHRLGAYCRTYELNMYGERTDALNAGLPATDRLIAEWNTIETEIRPSLNLENCQPVLLTERDSPPYLRQAQALELPAQKDGPVSLEIPGNLRRLLEYAPEEARHWQKLLREAFQGLFALGYTALDFARKDEGDERRGWYLLD